MTVKEAIRHLGTYSSTNGSGQTTQAEHEEAKRMARKALEQSQWIPCSAGFPEDWEKVLVTTKDGAIQFGFHHGKYWAYGAKVIAWMPLPEPYRKDGEK